ncbi:DUF4148 domain-containing protein [Achromobacter mucicolens]|uniref:DUF4148 domain-containing protein n=1 Tax=Achromobacter mucicolens TaxID=1389922 RepID=A0ABD4Z403_9BURK|nr:DUF4148 domain-containing protein [Achromobacter mucicolens]MDG9971438.1 DUF4148 domain-containing protein [Achromobacter mucicolens]MDH1181304.1 DUF4148 domain-containing protein [Achromobacter mucicolens]
MKRSFCVIACALLLTACAASPSPVSQRSRAEVQADLAMWKKAGMARFYPRRGSVDFFSENYRSSNAEYRRLRNGPEYQAELERLRNSQDAAAKKRADAAAR